VVRSDASKEREQLRLLPRIACRSQQKRVVRKCGGCDFVSHLKISRSGTGLKKLFQANVYAVLCADEQLYHLHKKNIQINSCLFS
jgi:hypothetical protein